MKKGTVWVHAASLFCMSSSFSHGVCACLRHESQGSENKKKAVPQNSGRSFLLIHNYLIVTFMVVPFFIRRMLTPG